MSCLIVVVRSHKLGDPIDRVELVSLSLEGRYLGVGTEVRNGCLCWFGDESA